MARNKRFFMPALPDMSNLGQGRVYQPQVSKRERDPAFGNEVADLPYRNQFGNVMDMFRR